MAVAKVVNGLLVSADGVPRVGALIRVKLSQPAVVSGTSEVETLERTTTTAADGTYTFSLYSNADLTPTGTYYTVTEDATSGDAYTFSIIVPSTAGPFVMSSIQTGVLSPAVGPVTVGGRLTTSKDFVHSHRVATEAELVSGLDPSLAETVIVTLTANRIMGVPLPANSVDGQRMKVVLIEGGIGGFTLDTSAISVTNWALNLAAGKSTELPLERVSGVWLFAQNPPIAGDFFPSATDASIRAAALSAFNAGSGRVWLPPSPVVAGLSVPIALTSPLPAYAGVWYVGKEPLLVPKVVTTGPYGADFEWNYAGGTVLGGDGTFTAFEANATDHAGGAQSDLGNTQIGNAAFLNMGFDNFSYGIRVGALSLMGLVWSKLDKLYFRNCGQWATYLVNFSHLDIGTIRSCLCQNGQFYGVKMNVTAYQPGNSVFDELYHLVPRDGRDSRLCRGIVFEAAGDAGSAGTMNEIEVQRLQVNGYNRTLLSITATFSSGVNAIAVPDGTKFAVGMPVQFTTSAASFVANQMYVVLSVVSNTITLGNTRTGAVITPNANTTATLQTYGQANIEVTAANSLAKFSSSHFNHIDSEGTATSGLYVENAQQCSFDITNTPLTVLTDIVGRGAPNNRFRSAPSVKTDFDLPSNTSEFYGARNGALQYPLRGLYLDTLAGAVSYALQVAPGGVPAVGALQTNVTAQSVVGTANSGYISITTGAAAPASGNIVVLLTMTPAWDRAPNVILGTNDGFASISWTNDTPGTNFCNIRAKGTLAALTTYKIPYSFMPGA